MKLDIKITVTPDDSYSPAAKAETSIQVSVLSAETIASLARIAADDVSAQLTAAKAQPDKKLPPAPEEEAPPNYLGAITDR